MLAHPIKLYVLKITRKNSKPPIWMKAYVYGGVTYSQMALILEDMLEFERTDEFEFEFFHEKTRISEHHDITGKDEQIYEILSAEDTFVDDLFDKTKWFYFRIQGKSDLPEYRIDFVEKNMVDSVTDSDGNDAYPSPQIMAVKRPRNDKYWKVDGAALNRILGNRFPLVETDNFAFKKFNKIVEDVKSAHGLEYTVNPVSYTSYHMKSQSQIINELIAEYEKPKSKAESEKEKADHDWLNEEYNKVLSEYQKKYQDKGIRGVSNKNNYYTMRQWLNHFDTDVIDRALKDNDISTKGSKKAKVGSLATYLLDPYQMKANLIDVSEEALDIFEKVIEAGIYHFTDEEKPLMEEMAWYFYYVTFRDNYVGVPTDVVNVYKRLLDDGYRLYHKRMNWLIDCELCFEKVIAIGPSKVLYKMFEQKQELTLPFDEFVKLSKELPEELKECEVSANTARALVLTDREASYLRDEQKKRKTEYYIPDAEEIEKYAEYEYPEWMPEYAKIYDFFKDDLRLDDGLCYRLCLELFDHISAGNNLSNYLRYASDLGLEFNTTAQVNKFMSLYMDAHDVTREIILKGYNPTEMGELTGHNRELSNAGIESVDIPVSENFNQPVKAPKKIYPNDPCPCGSGKKYKNCCGRKGKK